MWKCPACETLNDKDICVICGEPKPASGADYTPPAAPSYVPIAEPYKPSSDVHTGYSSYVPPRSEPLDSAPKIDYSVPAYSPEYGRSSLDPAAPLDPAARVGYAPLPKKKSYAGVIAAVIILAIIAILVIVGINEAITESNDSSYSTEYSTETLTPYSNGYKWGYINSDGEIVIECIYTEAYEFKNGRARVCNSNGLYGYIDESGYLIIPCVYDEASDFYGDGTALVSYEQPHTFWINTSGVKVD